MNFSEYYNNKTKTLKLPHNFNEELKVESDEIEIIIFSEKNGKTSKFNQPVDNLPKNLKHLTFGKYFNQSVDNLPENLIHLTFNNNFNQIVDNLPKNLKHLTFGYDFNQQVDKLPESLTHLTFGDCFNQHVDNLPKNLTHLTFGDTFNQKVDNLPKNLTYLTFGYAFNQLIDNLPKNLTHLTFGNDFKQSIHNLPETLIYLKIGGEKFNHSITIPKNVKTISLFCDNYLINNLPEHIENLFIIFNIINNKKVENIPITIKKIVIHSKYYKKYIKIPFETIITFNSKEC